jgi:phosphoglycerate kinase
MTKLSIEDLPLEDKKILMRVDFNVPIQDDGSIADDSRIKAAIPSIKYLLERGGTIILMSHLGKPKGKIETKMSLAPCAKRLSELLKKPVLMASDCIGNDVKEMVKNLKKNDIILLENLRFHKAEEKPEEDESFAEQLSQLGDLYVNDAFGTAHRKHSSTYTITKYFPNKSAAGFLIKKEIEFLGLAISDPKRPFYAILGGAKVSSKMGVLINLLNKVDGIFIGGGMAYTFLKVMGINIGNSLFEETQVENVKKILKKAEEKNILIHLPVDFVTADKFSNEANSKIVARKDGIPDGWEGLDMGPETISEWKEALSTAQTVFWNGPLGVFEFSNFANGTNQIALDLAEADCITIVGGGDSLSAINKLNLKNKFSHLSTGGGASLEYIEYGSLPAIEALSDK